ncbi:3-phosphoshikimate 1-carboxyvinyltransferase [Candidatus Fermentibacteria bacterium]|nr:MAG: 3-phosphoshikimate 1-carboxyvinyltransferase [Candidatus Fermentibacteria bacterium]
MRIPGSKYVANRALLISALARGSSVVSNIPENGDIDLLVGMLRHAGVSVNSVDGTVRTLEIQGSAGRPGRTGSHFIDAGESGTLLRFAAGFASLLDGETFITAGFRNRQRPLEPLLKSLEELGAEITRGPEQGGFPLGISRGLKGGTTVIGGQYSSQFISSLLLAAPYADNDVEVKVTRPVVSSHYIDLTMGEMARYGVAVRHTADDNHEIFYVQAGQSYTGCNLTIPGDWSSVNCLLAASLLLQKEIRVNGMNVMSNPAESEFLAILEMMGCCTEVDCESVTVKSCSTLRGIEVDMKDSPDSVLTLIPLALAAEGTTVIRNIGHLIYKESNRIHHAAHELQKLGAEIETTIDSISVVGGRSLKTASVDANNDHRLAMCLGLIELTNKGMKITGRDCVSKSFPEFWSYIGFIQEAGEKCLEIQ